MKTSRREFLKKSALAVATASVTNQLFSMNASPGITGVQLYSIKDEMKKDPMGTLKQLATMGYQHVEHANYVDRKFYGWTAKEFKKVLDDLGLKMPSGHTVLAKPHWDDVKKDLTDADRKSTRLNSSHLKLSRMPSSA